MQIVLLEKIERLGQMGDVVKVKSGYARNFLLPRKKALRATKANLAYFEKQKAHLEATNIRLKSEAEAIASRMQDIRIVIIRQASEVGQLYGSVRSQDIVDGLNQQGYSISRSQVHIQKPVKTLGVHPIKIALHPEVFVQILVVVAQSEEEAIALQDSLNSDKNEAFFE